MCLEENDEVEEKKKERGGVKRVTQGRGTGGREGKI